MELARDRKEYKREYMRKWRAIPANAEKHRRWSKQWQLNNPGRQAERRLLTLYGLTIEQYDERLKVQGGGCAVCGYEPEPGRRLAIDHDHDTGQVRGLLCERCNRALGLLKDDVDVLIAAVEYLEGGRW